MLDEEKPYQILEAIVGAFIGGIIAGIFLLKLGRYLSMSGLQFWFFTFLGAAICAFGAVMGGERFLGLGHADNCEEIEVDFETVKHLCVCFLYCVFNALR